jgi:hypothetical protein
MTHLFTGRDLEGNTIGLAYIGAVCDQRYGASLSESRDRGAWLDSLIAAHELGHSFGAAHDGVGECAATPIGYLMSPSIAGWDQFSQCSLNRMRATMSQATCLTTMPRGDISLAAQLGSERATLNQEFDWALQVTNIGNAPIESGLVYINVPGALTVSSTSTSNGHCTFGAGIVECTLSDLAPNESRIVSLRMRGTLTGNFGISATVSAMGDANLDNNAGVGSMTIDSQTPTPASGTAPQPTPTASAPEQAPASGGGAVHIWLLLSLAMLLRTRQSRS